MDAEPHLQDHFQDAAHQAHAARFGMWVFLATELLLFGALLLAYTYFRSLFPAGFAQASRHLHRALGAVDTWVLVTSSLTMALSIHHAAHDQRRRALLMLVLTIALGTAFLGIHGFEYATDIEHGALPGIYYRVAGPVEPGAPLFFTLYYLMTGLHSLHVIIGVALLGWLGVRVWSGELSSIYYTPLECGGLYWHLVDLIWIFLFPLLYLI